MHKFGRFDFDGLKMRTKESNREQERERERVAERRG